MRFEGVQQVLKLKNYRTVVGVGREIFEIKLIKFLEPPEEIVPLNLWSNCPSKVLEQVTRNGSRSGNTVSNI